MGELDGVGFGRDQASAHEEAHDPFAACVTPEGVDGDPGADGFAVGCVCDEPEQHRAQDAALIERKAFVEAIGGPGDGAADAAGRPIPLDGEHSAVAVLPGLCQRMRQQRQGAGLALGVAHQQIDEAGFESKPGLERGAFDRWPATRRRPRG